MIFLGLFPYFGPLQWCYFFVSRRYGRPAPQKMVVVFKERHQNSIYFWRGWRTGTADTSELKTILKIFFKDSLYLLKRQAFHMLTLYKVNTEHFLLAIKHADKSVDLEARWWPSELPLFLQASAPVPQCLMETIPMSPQHPDKRELQCRETLPDWDNMVLVSAV